MSLKQLFYAALTARIISWLSFAIFVFCMVKDLELKTAVLCLGVSHLAWMLGTMFLGVFREQMTQLVTQHLESVLPTEDDAPLGPVDLEKFISHPLFEDEEEETND